MLQAKIIAQEIHLSLLSYENRPKDFQFKHYFYLNDSFRVTSKTYDMMAISPEDRQFLAGFNIVQEKILQIEEDWVKEMSKSLLIFSSHFNVEVYQKSLQEKIQKMREPEKFELRSFINSLGGLFNRKEVNPVPASKSFQKSFENAGKIFERTMRQLEKEVLKHQMYQIVFYLHHFKIMLRLFVMSVQNTPNYN